LKVRTKLLCSPSCVSVMAWTVLAVAITRSRVRRKGLRGAAPPSGWLPERGEPGVVAVLSRLEPTCLERSLVLQRWLADHGRPLDVVIGVKHDDVVRAHAWLEPEDNDGYVDLHRLAPPGVPR
jgi:Transglutaminase-like superfamily